MKRPTSPDDSRLTSPYHPAMERQSASRGYEIAVLIILSLVNGVVALDRLAVNFLSPFIVADLGLSNTQLGLLSSALSGAISVSGLLIAAVADRSGRQKAVLVWMLVAFSLMSGGAGIAAGFAALFVARLLLGVTEGPLVPIAQAIMGAVSAPRRRGFNMGTMQIGGAFLIGAMAGPVVIVQVAEMIGWRHTFFGTMLPGLVIAALVALFVRQPRPPVPVAAVEGAITQLPSIRELLRSRNLLLSMAIAALFTAWLTVQNVFLPRYLTETIGHSPQTMSWLLSLAGFGGLIGGIAIPALSDRFGRRRLTIVTGFASVLVPLALLIVPGSVGLLGISLVIGSLVVGCAPLVCAIIPSESVAPGRVATAVALSMCAAELVGGVLSPPLAGWAADSFGLRSVFWLDIALALACGALALALTETRKRS
ncbi:MFS transporter [Sphingobium nicotianae]|uniref:MFS transporter n=1 Tax=Sphingobium nicotianae TaxID=2782607 RepID=A0A9X1DA62_9SPHN|nr:MFS transporter [Sphingobium nicotianae]MBT2186203.1 MFS transporter [Sphingobium nicotianae]